MRSAIVILFFLAVVAGKLFCQDSLNYQSKWQTRPNFGINFPITNLLDGRTTDYLFEYGDNSMYWQILSVSFFFHKHWGVEFNFQGMTAENVSNRVDNFSSAMNTEYEENYFVKTSTSSLYHDFNPIGGHFERGFIGLIYRMEKNRIFIHPKFSIGVSSFQTDWGQIILKEKNSNNVIEVFFDSGKRPNDHFVLATSMAFGYKLTKRLYFNLDLMTSYYKTDITFTKNITDLHTNQSTSENFRYNKNIYTLSVGGGLILVIK